MTPGQHRCKRRCAVTQGSHKFFGEAYDNVGPIRKTAKGFFTMTQIAENEDYPGFAGAMDMPSLICYFEDR